MNNEIINKSSTIGKYLFASIMGIYGIQHFMYAGFVASLIPSWIPFHLFWVYFTGTALIAAAISIYLNRKAKWGCFLLGIMIMIFFAAVQVPVVVNSHFGAGQITSACKELGLASFAFVLAATYRE